MTIDAAVPRFGSPINKGGGMTIHATQERSPDAKATRLFLHIAFLSCLIFQRFGLVSGKSAIFLSTPLFLGLLVWITLTGRAVLRTRILVPFLAFTAIAMTGSAIAYAFPDSRVDVSLTSALSLIVNYAFLLIAPGHRFDREATFDVFTKYTRFIAAMGVIQYAIQYAGIKIFSFMVSFPFMTPILVEGLGYNYLPVTSYGSPIYKSNGFFLLEPSIFSQMLVLAVCVEFFVLRRLKFLPLYGVAYMVSYSGTGLLCLMIALPFFMFLFYRQASQLIWFGAAGVALVAMAAVALPSQFSALAGRSTEFTSSTSSGGKRYLGQLETLKAVIDEPRVLIGYGPGALDRASFLIPGTGGTIQKLIVDYGFLGMFAFFAFLLPAIWRSDISIIPLLSISLFLFGGGKLLAPYVIVLMALTCIWSGPPSQRRQPSPA